MPTTQAIPYRTFADVLDRVGHVPPERILLRPAPGTATEADLLDLSVTGGFPVELIDGILVEKALWCSKPLIATWLGFEVGRFLLEHNLGVAAGAGPIRLRPGLVRRPSVSFARWDSVPDPDFLEDPESEFLEIAPDLVIEMLNRGNTPQEITIKLEEYAKAGVKLVWYVDPERKEVDIYPKGNPKRKKTLGLGGVLDGGDVLPGFTLPVAKIFEKRAPAKKTGKKGKK